MVYKTFPTEHVTLSAVARINYSHRYYVMLGGGNHDGDRMAE